MPASQGRPAIEAGGSSERNASEPAPNAEHEAHSARALTGSPRERGGLPELPFVGDADIGGELPLDLVSKPKRGIDVGNPRADQPGRVGLAVLVDIDLGLP